MESRLPEYGLAGVKLEVVQGGGSLDEESVRGIIHTEKNSTAVVQRQLSEKEQELRTLRDSIGDYISSEGMSRTLLPELSSLFPVVTSVSTGRGIHTYRDGTSLKEHDVYLVNIVYDGELPESDRLRVEDWLKTRLQRNDLQVIFLHNPSRM
jgi:hypothetical protein